jgi:hypothetical protein
MTLHLPDAEILTERFSGIPKSYIAYRRGGEGKGAAARRGEPLIQPNPRDLSANCQSFSPAELARANPQLSANHRVRRGRPICQAA